MKGKIFKWYQHPWRERLMLKTNPSKARRIFRKTVNKVIWKNPVYLQSFKLLHLNLSKNPWWLMGVMLKDNSANNDQQGICSFTWSKHGFGFQPYGGGSLWGLPANFLSNIISMFLGNKNQCRRSLSREKFPGKKWGEILPKFSLGNCQSPKPLPGIYILWYTPPPPFHINIFVQITPDDWCIWCICIYQF